MNAKITSIFFLLIFQSLVFFGQCVSAEERIAPRLAKLAKFADSKEGAELLYAGKKTLVNDDFSTKKIYYYAIKINDEKAASDYGRIEISFNEYYADLNLLFANVLTASGEIKTLREDAVQKKTGGEQDFYDEKARLTFAPPQIEAGSILEFQYEVNSLRGTIPDFYSDSSSNFWFQPSVSGRGGRVDKVHRAVFQIEISERVKLETQILGPYQPSYKKRVLNKKAIYEWKWKKLPAVPVENAMPWWEELLPRIRVSTTKNWELLDAWSWSLIQEKIVPSAKIQNIVVDLVPPDAGIEEKIRAVYGYIQNNIRYVYAHLGRGGYEPHMPDDVIHQAYGDCKDQAVLAISLLKAMGIDAYPSLVVTPKADKPSTDLVGLYFDHMMVWVPTDDESGIWLDTTSNKQLFPGVSTWLVGQPAFILNGQGGKLTTIDKKKIQNQTVVNFNYRFNENSELHLHIKIKFAGKMEESIRSWLFYSENREQDINRLVRSAFDNLSPDSVEDLRALNIGSLKSSAEISARVKFGSVAASDKNPFYIGGGINQLMGMFSDLSSLSIPKARKQDWVNLQGESFEMNISIDPGPNNELFITQSAFDEKNDFFIIEQHAEKNQGIIQIQVRYLTRPLRLDSKEYKKFYRHMIALNERPNWKIGVYSSNSQFLNVELEPSEEDLTAGEHIAKAKKLIEEGKFPEAEVEADLAVKKNGLNGEAWYILGVAQGINTNFSGSDRSFKKSRELGFRPD